MPARRRGGGGGGDISGGLLVRWSQVLSNWERLNLFLYKLQTLSNWERLNLRAFATAAHCLNQRIYMFQSMEIL
jgi:hypothetical protein